MNAWIDFSTIFIFIFQPCPPLRLHCGWMVDGGLLWSGALAPQAIILAGRWKDRFDMFDAGTEETRHPSFWILSPN